MLSTFRNIENLTIWHNPITLEVLEKMKDLPLRMLSMGLEHLRLDEASKNFPAFRNITHLKIISTLTQRDCKALVNFPKLTHLCVFSQDEDMLDVLQDYPSLQVMICLPYDHRFTIKSDDPRLLVFWDCLSVEDAILEWKRSANGRIGFWELAEIIIEARKSEIYSFLHFFIYIDLFFYRRFL